MTRLTRSLVACALGMAAVAFSSPLRAETQIMSAERWHSTYDSKGLSRTHSGGLLGHLQLSLGLWGNYENNPVMLRDPRKSTRDLGPLEGTPVAQALPRRRMTALVGARLANELTFSLGLFEWVQVFGALPITVFQERGQGASSLIKNAEPLTQTAMGDIRLGAKIRILRQKELFVDLAFLPVVTLPLGMGMRTFSLEDRAGILPVPKPDFAGSPPGYGYTSDGFPTLHPQFALSRTLLGFFMGANAGLRLRRPYDFAGLTIANELTGSAGLGFKAKQLEGRVAWLKYVPVELGLEATGAVGLNHPYVTLPYVTPGASTTTPEIRTPNPIQPYQNSAELTATGGLELWWFHPYVGASAALLPGYGTPDFRLFAGVRVEPIPPTPPPTDCDKDGIPDALDQCQHVPGPASLRGCPPAKDSDGDGLVDDVDRCPQDPEDKDGFQDEDGCPDPDNDGDGVLDTADRCVMEPEDKDAYADEDGCPDPDNDGDGMLDGVDACPLEPEAVNGFQDQDGCPDVPPPADTDGDGLLDPDDRCPMDPEDKDGFEDQDGCPDRDNDQDGFLDAQDKCPNEPETINNNEDDDGCPDQGKTLVKLETER
ncbi:MAG: thrombospondin type 3 repeat-containing protein, partial [Myxococcota bacterium]